MVYFGIQNLILPMNRLMIGIPNMIEHTMNALNVRIKEIWT